MSPSRDSGDRFVARPSDLWERGYGAENKWKINCEILCFW